MRIWKVVAVAAVAALVATSPGGGGSFRPHPASAAETCPVDPAPGYSNIAYGPYPEDMLDIFLPSGPGPFPAVLVVHGGGWSTGDKDCWHVEASRLATEDGFVTITPNFRMAARHDDHPFPAPLEDLQMAVEWLRANAANYGIDPDHIGALGESSGANLAGLVATLGSGALNEGSRLDAVASWSGPMDLPRFYRETIDQYRLTLTRYLGCKLRQCPDTYRGASPEDFVDPSDPPFYLANSTMEFIPEDQATSMRKRLDADGIPAVLRLIPGDLHGRDYEDQVWDQTVKFLKACVPEACSF